jgi:hypothetical protein
MRGRHFPLILAISLTVRLTAALSTVISPWVGQSTPDLNRTVRIDIRDETPFQALLKLGLAEHIPFGIEVDQTLCGEPARPVVKDTVSRVISSFLAPTDATWTITEGAVRIQAKKRKIAARLVGDLKIDQFQGMNTSFQGLGIILTGHIYARLHPRAAYAGDILSSSESTPVAPFSLQDATVEEIADHVVSLDSRGVWIRYAEHKPDPIVRIYSYRDDAKLLKTLSCSP